MTPPAVKKRLGEMLLDAGVIDQAGLTSALAHQRQWGVRLGQALVELRIATEKDIVAALSKKLAVPQAQLEKLSGLAYENAQALVPREFASKHNVMPVADDGNVLTIAMSDPGNLAAIDELVFRTGRRLKVNIGGDREIAAAIRRYYGVTNPRVESIALDEDDEAATAIMPLVGHEHMPEAEEEAWRAPPARLAKSAAQPQAAEPPRAPAPRQAAPLVRTDDDERAARAALLGSVPESGFDVEKTSEVEYPDLLSDDILEPELVPEEPELEDPFLPRPPLPTAPLPAAPPPVAPPQPAPYAPPPAQATRPAMPVPAPVPAPAPALAPEPADPSLPSRAAAAVAAVASRGATDPALADAARVLAAVLRVLLRKNVVSDHEIAEELRMHTPAPRPPGQR
ncbi:MAG: hypothetical protein U0229_10880 [Anaeromyxobacter sp.]